MRITSMPDLPAPEIDGRKPSPTSRVTSAINQLDNNESPKPTPPVVKEEIKVPDEQISPKYADFAKKEALLRSKIQAERNELKQREDAFKAKEADYNTNYIPKSKIPEYFQKGNLQDLGLTGEQITQALLNQPSPQDLKIQELESKLAALTGIPDQTKKMFEDRDKQAYDQAIHVIRTDVKSLVKTDPQFEIIKSTESENDVVELIEKTFKEGSEELGFSKGHLLGIDEAAKIIEDKLTEELLKYSQLEKIKQKLQPAPVVKDEPVKQAPRTLTHSQAIPAQRPMNARERAILAFEGKLT